MNKYVKGTHVIYPGPPGFTSLKKRTLILNNLTKQLKPYYCVVLMLHNHDKTCLELDTK